ncbi:hypothetical protein ACWCYY_25265 [Kitasatospora sp. NPDC001664]
MHTLVRGTFFGVDVVGSTAPVRTDRSLLTVRRVLYDALEHALRRAGFQPGACDLLDRGDGIMCVLAAELEPGLVVDVVAPALAVALRGHNRSAGPAEEIRLRAVLHTGVTAVDSRGYIGKDISLAFGLLDAPELRRAMAEGSADLVLAVTEEAWARLSTRQPPALQDEFVHAVLSYRDRSTPVRIVALPAHSHAVDQLPRSAHRDTRPPLPRTTRPALRDEDTTS